MSANVIEARGLTKRYGHKKVVDHLDLSVPRGAIYAFLGDNGAGKSTTIRMLTGLVKPDAGRSEVLGLDCWANAGDLRHRVGYVPEKPRFYDWMTVSEIGWFASGFHKEDFYPRYLKLAQRFRLDVRARLKSLSKGGYAKVGLALALAFEPEVLILDEPTSGLDLFIRREFLSSMVELAGEGRTILISSHGIAEVERVASHAAFVAGGRLLLAGSLEELRRRFIRVRLRFEGQPPLAAQLGMVLEEQVSGRQWQVVLLDADPQALMGLSERDNVFDYVEDVLSLEEMYVALLAGHYRSNGKGGPRTIVSPPRLPDEHPSSERVMKGPRARRGEEEET